MNVRRTLTTIVLGVSALSGMVLPAVATEGERSAAAGGADGLLLTLIFGVLVGTVVTIVSYTRASFGEAPGHHEHADDLRQGVAEYEPDVPD